MVQREEDLKTLEVKKDLNELFRTTYEKLFTLPQYYKQKETQNAVVPMNRGTEKVEGGFCHRKGE
ncbi:hypothetical protein D0466_00385 [Peribacillus glennii]|uniref:Uncharacterized protein n=1 Tax=Peribacillus glennii TaxID=2303991 RepID=A0A372LKI4_9BACI|nr:hypothetical protein D0466_00385 [Peribacillus glennii]